MTDSLIELLQSISTEARLAFQIRIAEKAEQAVTLFRQHQAEDGSQYPYIKIGKYILAAYPEYIWIGLDGDGEGGVFDEASLEMVIARFYRENF